tara:strand:+ start:16509 stop:18053 length:1545 start_codon:yes stop_codon:yes gene_type:complete
MSKFSLLAISLGLAFACSGPARAPIEAPVVAENPPQAADPEFVASEAMPPRVYSNDSGITLNMVFFEKKGEEPAQALVQFTGASFPGAGRVMLATDRGTTTSQNWKIQYDGQETHIVSVRLETNGPRVGELMVRLRMPRSHAYSKVQLDLEASRALDTNEFIATHLRHRADGSLATFAKIDRQFHREKQIKSMDGRTKNLKESCGEDIPYEIDFKSISDTEIAGGPICERALTAVTRACTRDVGTRNEILKHVSKIRCSHGPENSLSQVNDGTLHFTLNYQSDKGRKQIYVMLMDHIGIREIVLEDDKKRIVVFDPDAQGGPKDKIYLGDDKTLRHLRWGGQSRWTWDPHSRGSSASFERTKTGWSVKCRKKQIDFHAVSPQRRESILKNATREESLWKREEFSLARDNRGIYYYVDRFVSEHGGKNFRVFKGPRGQLEETKLVDIVDDSDGMIFATQRGKLRLVIGSTQMQEAVWIEGKTRHKLVVLPLYENVDLIYTGLGIYDGNLMGTVCE